MTRRPTSPQFDPKILDARAALRLGQINGQAPSVQVRALARVPLSTEQAPMTDHEALQLLRGLLADSRRAPHERLVEAQRVVRAQLDDEQDPARTAHARQIAQQLKAIKRAP